jgi:tetratricopeptide (TPR) repeat protein
VISSQIPTASSFLPRAIRIATLTAAVVAVYANSFDGVFVFDDNSAIVDNPAIRRFEPLAILGGSGTRPLWELSLAANYAWGGLDPFGYHLFNLLVHLAAVWLLFTVVRATLRSPRFVADFANLVERADNLAFVTALLWAVHPLNTQAVTYIVQRCEAMMAVGFLGVLWCLAGARTSPRPWLWRCGAALAFIASVGSKEVGWMAIPVGWLYDWIFFPSDASAPSPPLSWRRRAVIATAMLGLVLAALWWIQPVLLKDESAGFGTLAVTPWQYFRSQPGVIAHYLRLIVWPDPLCLDYGWPVENRWLVGILLPGLALSGWFVAGIWLAWRRSVVGFPALAFFLILAPTSSIVPIQDLAFEHRMYLPAAVLIATVVVVAGAAMSAAMSAALRRWEGASSDASDSDHRGDKLDSRHRVRQRVALASAIVVLASVSALGVVTVQRNHDYHNAVGMWQDVLSQILRRRRPATNLHRVMANLGLELHKAGRTGEAIEVFEEGLRAAPESTAIRANYAQALIDLERFGEASAQLSKVLAVEPRSPRFVHQAALIAARSRRLDEAETLFRRAIQFEPQSADFHVNLAQLLSERARWTEALDELTLAAELYGAKDPRRDDIERRVAKTRAGSHFEYGNSLRRQGELLAARAEYEQAITLDPTLAQAHNNLGGLAMSEAPAEAVRHFANAVEQAPNYVEARFNLAQALLSVGQVEAAVGHLWRIVADRPDFAPAQQSLRQIEARQRRLIPR